MRHACVVMVEHADFPWPPLPPFELRCETVYRHQYGLRALGQGFVCTVIRRIAEIDPPLFFGSVRVAIPLNDGPVVRVSSAASDRLPRGSGQSQAARSLTGVPVPQARLPMRVLRPAAADVIGDVPVHIMFCQPERSPVHGFWHRIARVIACQQPSPGSVGSMCKKRGICHLCRPKCRGKIYASCSRKGIGR